MALWLVSKGARSLLLLSRTGVADEDSKQFVQELQAKGI